MDHNHIKIEELIKSLMIPVRDMSSDEEEDVCVGCGEKFDEESFEHGYSSDIYLCRGCDQWSFDHPHSCVVCGEQLDNDSTADVDMYSSIVICIACAKANHIPLK